MPGTQPGAFVCGINVCHAAEIKGTANTHGDLKTREERDKKPQE